MPPRDRRAARSSKEQRKAKKKPAEWTIPPVVQPDAKTLQFSFKYLDTANPQFPVQACSVEFWVALAKKIKEYSQWPVDAFEDQNHEAHRHTIDFTETNVPQGFAHLGTDGLAYVTTWQFQVGVEKWRVLGFLLDEFFYIVWLDPNHSLYWIKH